VHLTDLGTGRDIVIRSGWTEYPFRFGDLAVWPDVAVQDRAVELKAVSLTSGEPASLPAELRTNLSAPMYVSGDENTFVWSANDLSSLRAWRSGAPDPITIIAQVRQGEYLQWPNVAGPIVTWDNGSAWFVADLRSGSYAQITPEFGATTLTGDALVVSYAPTGTKELPVLDSTLIRPSHLPQLPACP
jgi:hypothetical protein